MQSETLPSATQPDEPPHVPGGQEPCHTGKAARVCSFDLALAELPDAWVEALVDVALDAAITCISCGVPLGSPHLASCAFKS